MSDPVYDFARFQAETLQVPPSPLPAFDRPGLTPFQTRLKAARIGVLTTCGVYFPEQEWLGETADIGYRLRPSDRVLRDLLIAHRTPIRVFAEAHPNIAYPRHRLIELGKERAVGRGCVDGLFDQALRRACARDRPERDRPLDRDGRRLVR